MTQTPKELTEKWKTRSLPSGWYYIKIEGFKGVDIDLYDKEGNSWLCNSDKDLNPLNVIAPVPTYDEYKAMQAHLSYHEKCISIYEQKEKLHTNDSIEYNKLEKENNNLRDLLRECKPYLSYKINKDKHVGFTPTAANLLTRINAAIGESEE